MAFRLLPTVSFFKQILEYPGLTSIHRVRDIEYGRGTGRNIEEAKESAAYHAYNELYAELADRMADGGQR